MPFTSITFKRMEELPLNISQIIGDPGRFNLLTGYHRIIAEKLGILQVYFDVHE